MERIIKNKKTKRIGKRGVSLIEILVTIFIFSLIMIASVAAFSTFFKARKTSREVQRGLEESRAALEMMAKNIRMSSKLTGCVGGVPQYVEADYSMIIMFNNTQKQCIVYEFSGGKLRGRFVPAATVTDSEGKVYEDPDSCAVEIDDELDSSPLSDEDNLINEGTVSGLFYIVPTTPIASAEGKIGKAAMKVDVISGSVTSHIQTSVSFRDFEGELY